MARGGSRAPCAARTLARLKTSTTAHLCPPPPRRSPECLTAAPCSPAACRICGQHNSRGLAFTRYCFTLQLLCGRQSSLYCPLPPAGLTRMSDRRHFVALLRVESAVNTTAEGWFLLTARRDLRSLDHNQCLGDRTQLVSPVRTPVLLTDRRDLRVNPECRSVAPCSPAACRTCGQYNSRESVSLVCGLYG